MIIKGLPEEYKPFSVVITQSEDTNFSSFKTKLRNFEETERSRTEKKNDDNVMKVYNKYKSFIIIIYTSKFNDHFNTP